MGKTKFYAVAVGRVPGVYDDWRTCEEQVKKFRSARFKSFPTREEAEAFVRGNSGNDSGTEAAEPTATAAAAKVKEESTENHKKRKLEPPREPRHWLIRVYFDGGSRGNPGIGGSGAEIVVLENMTTTTATRNGDNTHSPNTVAAAATSPVVKVLQERKKIHVRKYLGTNATNNQAEYQGLIAGVQRARQEIIQLMTETSSAGHYYLFIVNVEIRGDSELIIRQLRGDYKCRHPQLKVLYQQVKDCVEDLMQREHLELRVTYDHVYRKDNSKADVLANEAMDAKVSSETVFHTDGTISNSPLTS